MRNLLSLSITVFLLIACVKVEEQPALVEIGTPDTNLVSVNNCYISDNEPYYSFYEIYIPINNIQQIILNNLTIATDDGDYPFTLDEINIIDGQIFLEVCYLFENNDEIHNELTISATNSVGESIQNLETSFTIERPVGAN